VRDRSSCMGGWSSRLQAVICGWVVFVVQGGSSSSMGGHHPSAGGRHLWVGVGHSWVAEMVVCGGWLSSGVMVLMNVVVMWNAAVWCWQHLLGWVALTDLGDMVVAPLAGWGGRSTHLGTPLLGTRHPSIWGLLSSMGAHCSCVGTHHCP